jgi:hypothetical protein
MVDEMRSTGVLHKDIDVQERKELLETYYQSQAFATAFTNRYCLGEYGKLQGFARVRYQTSPPDASYFGKDAPGTGMSEARKSTTAKVPNGAGETSVEDPENSSEAGGATTHSNASRPGVKGHIVAQEGGATTFAQSLPIRLAVRDHKVGAWIKAGNKRGAEEGEYEAVEHGETVEQMSGVHEEKRRQTEKLADVTLG